ncbi:hypothetical protein DL93DRAFT_2054101 [Clavulina sp. PMI_390]|nr:hypothetical protein DL93DRAFT_2054101 [Clavulina sp. PMI_390]
MESPANATLLNVGTKCKADHCGLHDFLPYKCQFCSDSFCSDHFRPAAHHCDKFVASDRIAPPCPFCQTPISMKPNEDPNDAMETHFTTTCAVMVGKDVAAKSKTPRCSRNNCTKVLYTPITCESCSKQFCASHRHPTSHKCVNSGSTPSLPKASSSAPSKGRTDLADRLKLASPTKAKVATASPAKPSPAKPVAASPKASGNDKPAASRNNPFSKVDRWVPPSLFPTSTSDSASPSTSIPSSTSAPTPLPLSATAAVASTPAAMIPSKDLVQVVIDSNAQKPRPHILFSSYNPPSIFGAA